MAGLYLHIPFCKQACHYCNFHFSTSVKYKEDLLKCMLLELEHQNNYLEASPLNSIYLGGGTPSLLSPLELERLFDQIFRLHTLAEGAEITLEANPDDLSPAKLKSLAQSPVNRLSIGIQSFHPADLQFMNRAHTAREAQSCLAAARQQGFDQLSIDLIYGTPGMTDRQWEANLRIARDFGIDHLSAYCLTVEPRTALHHFVKKGSAPPVDEQQASRQFGMLMDWAEAIGFEHYEISNFAPANSYAVHNTSYWQGAAYLGIGPSAHSFDGHSSRQWNVANNAKYIRALQQNELPYELEKLSADDRYNEYVMTGLRTMWGCDVKRLDELGNSYTTHFEEAAASYLAEALLVQKGDVYRLSRAGKLLADQIAADLFVTD